MEPIRIIALIAVAILMLASLLQMIWTWRALQRIRIWLADERAEIKLTFFTRLSIGGSWAWFVMMVLVLAVHMDASRGSGAKATEVMPLSAAAAFWCLIQLVVSWRSSELCRLVRRFAAARRLGEHGLAEAAKLFPEGMETLVSREKLQREVSTLGRVTLIWLSVLALTVTVVAPLLLGLGLESIASSFGQLLLLLAAFILPGVIALFVVRWVVAGRAQRAQFLWFLAVTTQKQRPLASELTAWAQAHPGRHGSRVREVARDIGVGDTLADSLGGQRGLVTPSDLMSIRVAEQTGTLPETLRECAVRQTQSLKSASIGGSATAAALWLWAVVVTAATVLSFLMYFIVPKFKRIFWNFGTELPRVTKWVIGVSDLLANWGLLFGPLFVAASCLFLWTCGEAFLRGWSETWLAWKTGWGRQAEVPRLLRRLRAAVLAKMPWPAALQPMVLNHPQDDVRARLERVLGRVTAGMAVWPAMRDSGLLNARDVSLLEMAERANNLEWALAALAEAKERSLSHRWQVLTTMSVPAFTLCAGVVVLLICAAFFLPVVKLLNDLS